MSTVDGFSEKDSHHNGCLLNTSAPASRPRADLLTPNITHFNPTIQPNTSEPSFLEPLNFSLASRSSSSPSSPPSDITSFTTASQQTPWHSSPAPQAYRQAPLTNQTVHSQQDFVLYDQTAHAYLRPQLARSVSQPGHLFKTGPRFYANSAPSSTTEFQQPPPLRQRPPVPLFSSSSNIPPQQQNNASMADLNSNNSFDSGASLMPTFQNEWSMDPMSTFTAINNHTVAAGSTRTVSPKDIFADPFGLDAFGSAPPSAAFTNLTSPDVNDSPFADPYDCSPLFNVDHGMSTEWPSLFPEEESKVLEPVMMAAPLPLPMERTMSNQSMERSSSSSNGSPYIMNGSFGRKSSITNSPATNGISKSRRRKGPLPAIVPDPQDKIAYKRARNTLAARESRQRKFAHVEELEKRNSDLEAEVEKWKRIAMAHGYDES